MGRELPQPRASGLEHMERLGQDAACLYLLPLLSVAQPQNL